MSKKPKSKVSGNPYHKRNWGKGRKPRISKPRTAEGLKRKQRYGCKLLRVYYTDKIFAGYFQGEIPSVNELTLDVHATKRRAPTSKVRVFINAVVDQLSLYRQYLPPFKFFYLDLAVYVPVYHGNGNVIMRDASNFVKIAEDSICKSLETDDKFNLDVAVHKRNLPQGQKPHWIFVLIGREDEQHAEEGNEEWFPSIAFKRHAEESGIGEAPKG